MVKHIRLLLAAIVVLTALGAAVANAVAAEITIEPANVNTNTISLGLISFSSSLTTVSCRVTFLFRLLRGPIAKVSGNQVGTITRASIGGCAGGISAAALNREGRGAEEQTVEWPTTLESILGTLPSAMTGIRFNVLNIGVLSKIPTMLGTQNCLYEGTAGILATVTGSNPYTHGLLRFTGSRIPLKAGAALNTLLCPEEASLQGTFSPEQTIRISRT